LFCSTANAEVVKSCLRLRRSISQTRSGHCHALNYSASSSSQVYPCSVLDRWYTVVLAQRTHSPDDGFRHTSAVRPHKPTTTIPHLRSYITDSVATLARLLDCVSLHQNFERVERVAVSSFAGPMST